MAHYGNSNSNSNGNGHQPEGTARARSTHLVRWAQMAAELALLLGLIGLGTGGGSAGASVAFSSSGRTLTITDAHIAKVGTVLTTKAGFTLYHFTADPTGKATCTGPCAKVWPPALVPSGDKIKGPRGLKGFSTIRLSGGRRQLAFHGEALYRFAGDTHKGSAGGQGVEGTWFAVLASNTITPRGATAATVPPATSGSVSPTTTSGAAKVNASTTPANTAPATKASANKAPAKTTTTTVAAKGASPVTVPTTTPTTSPAPPPTTTTPTTAPKPPPTTTPTTTPPSGGYGY